MRTLQARARFLAAAVGTAAVSAVAAGPAQATTLPALPVLTHSTCHRSEASLRSCHSLASHWAGAYWQLVHGLHGWSSWPANGSGLDDDDAQIQMAGWLSVLQAAEKDPTTPQPIVVSFDQSMSVAQLAAFVSKIRGAAPTDILARVPVGSDTITVGSAPTVAPAAGVATTSAIAADLTDALNQANGDLGDHVASLQEAMSDEQALALANPTDADAASDVTQTQLTLASYQKVQSMLAIGAPVITSLTVNCPPAQLLAAALTSPDLAGAMMATTDSGTAIQGSADTLPAAVAIQGDAIASGARASLSDPSYRRALRSQTKARKHKKATRAFVATGPYDPIFWAPNRYTAKSGLLGDPDSKGLYKKRLAMSWRWTKPGTLDAYAPPNKFDGGHGLEMQAFPLESRNLKQKLWSVGWYAPFLGQGKQWDSNAPKAYLDDITYDVSGFNPNGTIPGAPVKKPQGHAVFAVGVPWDGAKQVQLNKLYTAWYVTDRGEVNDGHVTVAPELTRHDARGTFENLYCGNPIPRSESACHFSLKDVTVDPALRLRHRAHYVCVYAPTFHCTKDSETDQYGNRLEAGSVVRFEADWDTTDDLELFVWDNAGHTADSSINYGAGVPYGQSLGDYEFGGNVGFGPDQFVETNAPTPGTYSFGLCDYNGVGDVHVAATITDPDGTDRDFTLTLHGRGAHAIVGTSPDGPSLAPNDTWCDTRDQGSGDGGGGIVTSSLRHPANSKSAANKLWTWHRLAVK